MNRRQLDAAAAWTETKVDVVVVVVHYIVTAADDDGDGDADGLRLYCGLYTHASRYVLLMCVACIGDSRRQGHIGFRM